MSDIHTLSGAYALDALLDLERAEFERHLSACDACRAEVASLREAASHLAEASATPWQPVWRKTVSEGWASRGVSASSVAASNVRFDSQPAEQDSRGFAVEARIGIQPLGMRARTTPLAADLREGQHHGARQDGVEPGHREQEHQDKPRGQQVHGGSPL